MIIDFNGLAVLILYELGKSRLEISNESVSDKTIVEDLINGLDLVLNQSFLLKAIPHPGYTQGRIGITKLRVHLVGKFLPRVVPWGILLRVIPNKGKAF